MVNCNQTKEYAEETKITESLIIQYKLQLTLQGIVCFVVTKASFLSSLHA